MVTKCSNVDVLGAMTFFIILILISLAKQEDCSIPIQDL